MSALLTRRYLHDAIVNDLKEKMVFLGGPRQVGKTTFAQSLDPTYLNWDDPVQRDAILKKHWPSSPALVALDELHKYAKWRNLIKGYYDTLKQKHQFLVTGSARLDYYRKGGDSLLGRYHYYRMHPLSLPEIGGNKESLGALLKFGGFPEPFFAHSEKTLRRWHLQRLSRVIREDLVDLERVKELTLVERLAENLPTRVGSILSIKNLGSDLGVDFKTANRWITILENLYFCFRVAPYGPPKIRAVVKEQKLYLWDWSQVESPGPRFENLVASQLLKFCHFREDTEGFKMELRFLRDTDKREVDFVVLQDKSPLFAVECKSGDKQVSPHFKYFLERTKIPKFYQVHTGSAHFSPHNRVEVLPFERFCKEEGMV